MRVLVCGGRDYRDIGAVFRELNALHRATPISALIEGGAHGADELAALWADNAKVSRERYAADWKTHGKAAGPYRNATMIQQGKPDLVVAFPGGRGTADMIARAERAAVKVVRVARN